MPLSQCSISAAAGSSNRGTFASGCEYQRRRPLGVVVVVRSGSEVMAVGSSVASRPADPAAKPLLGLRRRPGRLALAVFRLPLPLYRRGWGGRLGHTFLLLVHAGRKTGKPHSTTAMVLRYDPQTREAVICSAWGKDTDWIRNIRARPALRVQIGRESFTPQQRFLSPRRRAWPWWPGSGTRTQGGCGFSSGSWAAVISALIPPPGTSSAPGRSSPSVRPIPPQPGKARQMANENRPQRSAGWALATVGERT
jgi:deazaflavin-dependent oxidoreductase (nitroreductase family)